MKFFKLITLCLVFTSCNQPTNETKERKSPTPLSDLKFLEKRYDFGVVNNDTLLTARYNFVNTGENDLVIQSVLPDCYCTSSELSKKIIAPGDTAYIKLNLKTKGKGAGPIRIYATVEANTVTRLYNLSLIASIAN